MTQNERKMCITSHSIAVKPHTECYLRNEHATVSSQACKHNKPREDRGEGWMCVDSHGFLLCSKLGEHNLSAGGLITRVVWPINPLPPLSLVLSVGPLCSLLRAAAESLEDIDPVASLSQCGAVTLCSIIAELCSVTVDKQLISFHHKFFLSLNKQLFVPEPEQVTSQCSEP